MGSNLHLRTLDDLSKLIIAKTEEHRSYQEEIKKLNDMIEENKAQRQKMIEAREKSREERTDYCNEFRRVVASKNLDSFQMKAALQQRTDYFGHLGNPYAVAEIDQ